MADVFRIQERFEMVGRGVVYTVKIPPGAEFRIGEILLDLRGNHFKVQGAEEMPGRIPYGNFADMPTGVVLEATDGVQVSGTILVRELQNINFLFCNHPLYQRSVDEDYDEEYQAASLRHPCALFSYEDLEEGKLSLRGESISGLTIYRGWMMKPELYRTFYALLAEKGILLINSPDEYQRYHLLPGWYSDFAGETAESVWESEGSLENAMSMSETLEGPYVVKDYVKSRKHEWYDACFIEDIADREHAAAIINNFISRQGEGLVGGVVLRRFEALRRIGFHEKSKMPLSEEYRVFVCAGKIAAVDNYWTGEHKAKLADSEYLWVESVARRIRSNFVTIDLARKEDKSLMIMEIGDGQVSGLQQLGAEAFYRGLTELGLRSRGEGTEKTSGNL